MPAAPAPPAAPPEAPIRKGPLGWPKRLLRWTLSWAEHPAGPAALSAISFAESSFFPIPPDVLLIPLCLGKPGRSLRFALYCTVASVLGGCLGYLIGVSFYEAIGVRIVAGLGYQKEFEFVKTLYARHAFLWVSIAGLTPIPYKLFTIAAGVCRIDFATFVLASAISRGARFFAEGLLIYFFRDRVRRLLDRYLEAFMIAVFAAGVGGYLAIRWLWAVFGVGP